MACGDSAEGQEEPTNFFCFACHQLADGIVISTHDVNRLTLKASLVVFFKLMPSVYARYQISADCLILALNHV